VEEQFYLVMPLLIVSFTKKVFYFFPLFIAGSILFRYVSTGQGVHIGFHTLSVCSSLFVGCLMAYLVLYHNFSRLFTNLNRGVIACVYLLFFAFHFYRDRITAVAHLNIFMYFLYSLFFAFFILEQNYAAHSFYKMCKIKVLTSWGKYTYGLYAYHMVFITLLMVIIPQYFNPAGNYVAYFSLWIVALAATFLCAKVSYLYMEKPFLKLKEKFSRA
jgi:peptidoglycan/LPS O-acetylase OafA/YrhL